MNYNKATIIGRLTQDPEKRTIPNTGTSVVNVGVATTHSYKDKNGEKQEIPEFHNVVLFGKAAELVEQYLSKGSLAMFEGRLQTRSWEGKDGVKRYRTEIVADQFVFGPKSSGGGSSSYSPQNTTQEKKEASSEGNKKEIPVIDEDDDIDVKDIPF